MVQLILALACLLWGPLAHATTYYVATAAGGGNNSNNGTSEATPKLTPKACVDLMVAGDTCYVRGGTYSVTTDLRFRVSGTQAAPITFTNYPGEYPVLLFNATQQNPIMLTIRGNVANSSVGWLVIQGFEISGAWVGVRWENLHNSIIRNMWLHDNVTQGILGGGGHHNLIDRNIVNHNGNFAACAAAGGTGSACTLQHGIYVHGDTTTIIHNVIYDNLGYGIQSNGSPSSYFDPARHPSAAFAEAKNWIIANNTIAYNRNKPAIVIWGERTTNMRIENNILYENFVTGSTSFPQGIEWVSPGATSGIQILNNHSFGSGSGGQVFIGPGATEGVHYTQSGNVSNVSAPAFVLGGSNSLPASPDFRLTASAPVNIALPNEFPNNPTNVVGAFRTVPNPTGSITARTMTLVFSSVSPLINISTDGVSVACSGTACPGSPTVSVVGPVAGTDLQVEVVINGIAGDACELNNQNWTVSYDAGVGSWTNSDNIGPFPGLHQKIFSFTNLPVTNDCTGSGTPPDPVAPYLRYKADEGSGTTLTNTGSLGASGNGTLTGGATWGPGHTGSGMVLTALSGQYGAVPWGSGIDPTAQSFTLAFAVFVDPANVCLGRGYVGSSLGNNQRFYVSTGGCSWRIGIQTSNDAAASELSVASGWNYIVVRMDKDTPGSGIGTATLCVNRVCSTTAGGRKTYASYILNSNLEWGRLGGLAGGAGGTFDDFSLYLNATVNPDDLYDAFTAGAPGPTGTFAQVAVQAQAVYLSDIGAPPTNFVTLATSKEVVAGGGVAWVFQIHCTNVSDCAETSFRPSYLKNDTGVWQAIPNVETADGISMWGNDGNPYLNNNATTTRLTGSCAVTNGVTLLTAAQVPPVDLPQDGCVMMRVIVRIGNIDTSNAPYFDLRMDLEGGVPFTGSMVLARIKVVPHRVSAGW